MCCEDRDRRDKDLKSLKTWKEGKVEKAGRKWKESTKRGGTPPLASTERSRCVCKCKDQDNSELITSKFSAKLYFDLVGNGFKLEVPLNMLVFINY
jgi:hypothetical protein